MQTDALNARLDAIEAKLDRVLARQQVVEDFVDEMMPVTREVIRASGVRLKALEDRGYFAFANELLGIVDRVVTSYEPEDVAELGRHVVEILDTVRNLTQPDVLDIANEAADVIHDADKVEPVGVMGAMRATRDDEVRHGMAIALEILRHLGRSHGQASARGAPPERRPLPEPTRDAYFSPAPKPERAPEPPPSQNVQWKGHWFTPDGFLVDPTAWDEALGSAIAEALGIEMTDEHWEIVRWVRNEYLSTGASPNVRRIATGTGVGTRRIYELFPHSPGKTVARIAGVPKPVGCI